MWNIFEQNSNIECMILYGSFAVDINSRIVTIIQN